MQVLLEVSSGPGLYGERLAVILGFITLAFAVATFASCRSCIGFITRIGIKNPMEYAWYRAFNRYHGYYWSFFLLALTLHVLSSVMHTAIPKGGAADAGVHWLILSFGLGSLALVGITLLSCRSWVALVGMFSDGNLLANRVYKPFFKITGFIGRFLSWPSPVISPALTRISAYGPADRGSSFWL